MKVMERNLGQSLMVGDRELTITRITIEWITVLLDDGTECDILLGEIFRIGETVLSFKWLAMNTIELTISPLNKQTFQRELMCA